MKVYIELPHKEKFNKANKSEYLPLLLAIIIDWHKFRFSYPKETFRFPYKDVIGERKLNIMIGILYWRFDITFYKELDKL